jgi:integrase
VNKKITLLSAILHKAVLDHGLKGVWHNPFEGLKIEEIRGAKNRRSSFNAGDLTTLLSQPFMVSGDKEAGGGKGLAARWLPLLAMFTGARRRELAQLKLADIIEEDGITFLRIIDSGDEQSVKVAGSIRRVPVHPELVKCGFLTFVAQRHKAGGDNDWLFDGLEANRKGDRADAWGRWFGRELRAIGIDAGGRKVFHSFRHTFISRCREAEIEEEYRFALTGHSDGGAVGRGYGGDEAGFRHSLQRLHREISKVRYPGVDLSHLRAA